MHRSGENGRRPIGRTGQIAYLILRCPTLACLASRCYVSDVIFIRSLSYGWRSRIWVEYVSLGRRLRHPFKTTIYPKKKKDETASPARFLFDRRLVPRLFDYWNTATCDKIKRYKQHRKTITKNKQSPLMSNNSSVKRQKRAAARRQSRSGGTRPQSTLSPTMGKTTEIRDMRDSFRNCAIWWHDKSTRGGLICRHLLLTRTV